MSQFRHLISCLGVVISLTLLVGCPGCPPSEESVSGQVEVASQTVMSGFSVQVTLKTDDHLGGKNITFESQR